MTNINFLKTFLNIPHKPSQKGCESFSFTSLLFPLTTCTRRTLATIQSALVGFDHMKSQHCKEFKLRWWAAQNWYVQQQHIKFSWSGFRFEVIFLQERFDSQTSPVKWGDLDKGETKQCLHGCQQCQHGCPGSSGQDSSVFTSAASSTQLSRPGCPHTGQGGEMVWEGHKGGYLCLGGEALSKLSTRGYNNAS